MISGAGGENLPALFLPKRRKEMRKNPLQPKGWKIGTVLLLPVGVYIFMVIIPIFFAAYYSLFKWSGGKSMTFLGMQNYLDILRDDTFWLSFRNTAVFTPVSYTHLDVYKRQL